MHYFIGDIQGCYSAFTRLLEKLDFSPSRDRLTLIGDLIARGEDSLGVMQYVLDNQHAIDTILGNHDLHLLAVARGYKMLNPKDNTQALLCSARFSEIDEYLRHQPLVRDYKELGILAVHAGIWHSWTPKKAVKRSAEIEELLQDTESAAWLLKNMYGDGPGKWKKDLEGIERYRAIINICTRMRLLTKSGKLDLKYKGKLDATAREKGLHPWFETELNLKGRRLAFGHWAALEGNSQGFDDVIPLDHGCCWGGELTAFAPETGEFISVNADA